MPSQVLKGQQTVGQLMKKVGYHTAFLGKVHLGGKVFSKSTGKPKLSMKGGFKDFDFGRKVETHLHPLALIMLMNCHKEFRALLISQLKMEYLLVMLHSSGSGKLVLMVIQSLKQMDLVHPIGGIRPWRVQF